MSPLPTMNRSFLHGDVKKTTLVSEKIVYATLDSLALKRARLPLQLVPIDNTESIEDHEKPLEGKERCHEESSKELYSTECQREQEGPKENGTQVTSGSENVANSATEEGSEATKVTNCPAAEFTDLDNYELVDFSNGQIRPVANNDKRFEHHLKTVESVISDGSNIEENHSDKQNYSTVEKKFEQSENVDDEEIYSNFVVVDGKGYAKSSPRVDENESFSPEDGVAPIQKKKKRHFAKKVLHYVPGRFVKRPKAWKKKKFAKCRLGTSLGSSKPVNTEPEVDLLKSKNLSKDELKYVTISSPTNFVHVASATNSRLVFDESAEQSSLERVVITHEEKCATLPLFVGKDGSQILSAEDLEDITNKTERTAYVEIVKDSTRNQQAPATSSQGKILENSQTVSSVDNDEIVSSLEERIYEPMCEFSTKSSGWVESSSTEDKRQKDSGIVDETIAEETYDDVGPPTFVNEECDYDDVGPPVSRFEEFPNCEEDENYDDVMAPGDRENERNTQRERDANDNGKTKPKEWENQYLSINNEYSSVEEKENGVAVEEKDEEEEEQAVYDDVALPSEERVNSLYAGSTPGSCFGSTSTNAKESEWEDLEDSLLGPPSRAVRTIILGKNVDEQDESSKKKSGQRRTRKTRKQRSRDSRKSSRSSTRTICESTTDVSVSLGSGSVILIGNSARDTEEKRRCQDSAPRRTEGLVQIRVVDLCEAADIQETSCYVAEGPAQYTQQKSTSDDSTYESLNSFQRDHSSTESEAEVVRLEQTNLKNNEASEQISRVVYLEAPTRPTPPPPREASLTQTIGKRMKMLRRTWSITKGSLGRMRRRTSIEDEHSYEDSKDSSNEHHVEDSRKYFSFKKHFRKSVTGLSTFYLNDGDTNHDFRLINNRKEPVYTNNNWCPEIDSGKNDNDSTRSDESTAVLDHYSVLTEEPLYQFYAAAAARVAFEMDSDGYEEVEDLNNLPAATELAKPGHRTLWCQTPQVIHSGLLRRLSVDEKKIQEAKFEIITSEASYLNSLRVLKNEFIEDTELINEALTPSEKERLFGGVPDVLSSSEKLLAELELVWREDPMLIGVPNVLLKHAEKCLGAYVTYCSNQVSIDATLKDLRARKGSRFLETVSRIETRPACQSLSLHSFLMLPMQRVTRLPLLADAVLSKLSIDHVDRPIWEKVLSTFSYVVTECNEGARAATQQAEMEALARKLEYQPKIKPIVLRGRSLVKSGQVVQLSMKTDVDYKFTFGKKFNKIPIYLLLLTDYLLVTKPKHSTHEEAYTVIDTCKRNVLALEPVSEDSPFAGRNAMMLTLLENYCGRQVEYVLTCDSNTERERWLEAVSPPQRGFVGETLYETWDCPQVMALYSYSARQPDELSLQPGEVINVLRKMVDGWYHGEKLLDGEQGWFPGNYTKEVASEHVRARNLKQRHRLLALSGSVLQRKATQSLISH